MPGVRNESVFLNTWHQFPGGRRARLGDRLARAHRAQGGQITHVINFDVPDTTEAYTHRIGRTGRAAKTGDAFTFVTHEDETMVRDIERALGSKIERRKLEGFDYSARQVAAPALRASRGAIRAALAVTNGQTGLTTRRSLPARHSLSRARSPAAASRGASVLTGGSCRVLVAVGLASRARPSRRALLVGSQKGPQIPGDCQARWPT